MLSHHGPPAGPVKLWADLQPHAAAGAYVNFLGDEGQALTRSAYRADYERLVALKDAYDPGNVFGLNQNVEPSGRGAAGLVGLSP
jgi:FAD/FMN-containing dehydrogenase